MLASEARIIVAARWPVYNYHSALTKQVQPRTILRPSGNLNANISIKLGFPAKRGVNGTRKALFCQVATNDASFSSNENKLSRTSHDENRRIPSPNFEEKYNEGEDPYRILDTGRKVYLDELDVLTLLDPPSFLIPSDPNNYNQAAYLWKKIADIPEERRHRLLDLLTPKHVANMWDITGQMYELSQRPSLEPASVLLGTQSELFMKPVTWTGKAFDVSWSLNWFSKFQKTFFLATDGSIYGRVTLGGWMLKNMIRWLFPLYFEVREIRKVIATEEPCNIALEYGDGQLHLKEVPNGFPKPGKHPWPFNDASFDYLRPAGPGVMVGQWWIEGMDLEQVPEKCVNFVLIKDYRGAH
ncbi:hypothetical protein KP509_12G045700 [Ceratopteris richardii]|uniref:Uncharacterized protein n=1 Tax=Ceratopteris richardii TaxID=49495 RepID=A0A8T2TP86_CERRI|nr:hypothetical protein KP509_12G045700 [Ceratopteris richardii]